MLAGVPKPVRLLLLLALVFAALATVNRLVYVFSIRRQPQHVIFLKPGEGLQRRFTSTVLNATTHSFVYLYSNKCRYCLPAHTLFDSVASTFRRRHGAAGDANDRRKHRRHEVLFVKVDVSGNSARWIRNSHGVQVLPHFALFKAHDKTTKRRYTRRRELSLMLCWLHERLGADAMPDSDVRAPMDELEADTCRMMLELTRTERQPPGCAVPLPPLPPLFVYQQRAEEQRKRERERMRAELLAEMAAGRDAPDESDDRERAHNEL